MYKTCILLFWSAVALSNTMFYEETVLSAEENEPNKPSRVLVKYDIYVCV